MYVILVAGSKVIVKVEEQVFFFTHAMIMLRETLVGPMSNCH